MFILAKKKLWNWFFRKKSRTSSTSSKANTYYNIKYDAFISYIPDNTRNSFTCTSPIHNLESTDPS